MRYWLNELKSVSLQDEQTVFELKNFVRYPNGTWKAREGLDLYDDRVMALIWALMILETSITQRYLEIVKMDDNDKPLIIKPLDFGIQAFQRVGGSVLDTFGESNAMPLVFGGPLGDDLGELDLLESQGWKRV